MSVTYPVRANLGATGLAGTAGFVVYNAADATVFQSRPASVSTIAAVGPTTTYQGSFSGAAGGSYFVIWDDGASTPNYTGAGDVNPSVNVAAVANSPTRVGDGTASAVATGSITLDANDPAAGSSLANWTVRILSATTGAGQAAIISSSNTSTRVQTLSGNWATTPTGVVVYELIPPGTATASLGTNAPAGWINAAAIATDAISATAVSAAAVTKIQTGLTTGDTAGTTTLLNRLTSTRAGYLDALQNGIPTGDTAGTTTLLGRLTLARAGYLDNLSAGPVAQSATALSSTVWTNTKAGFIDAAISGVTTGGTSASTIATAVWQDLLNSADFATTGSAGKLLRDSITAPVATASALATLSAAVGTPAQAAQIPANFTTATFAAPGVFASTALANGPTGSGSFVLADGSITSAKFAAGATIPRVTLVDTVTDKTGCSLTSAYDPAKTAAQASALATLSTAVGTPAQAATALSNATWTNARAGYLDALNAGIVLAANGLDNVTIETGYSAKDAMKVGLVADLAAITGNGTTTVTVGTLPSPTRAGSSSSITATMANVTGLVNNVSTTIGVDRTATSVRLSTT